MSYVNPSSLNTSNVSNPGSVAAVDGEEIFQLVKRADINPNEVEEVGSHAIEVSVLWERSILHVTHLDGDRSFVLATSAARAKPTTPALFGGLAAGSTLIAASAASGNYVVGAIGTVMALAGAGAGIALDQRNQDTRRDGGRFLVDAEMLGGASEMPVVRVENGTARFVFPKGARGEIEIANTKHSLEQLVSDGTARAVPGTDGAFEIELRQDARYRVTLGSLTVMARLVARARRIVAPVRRDPATIWAGLGAAGAVATIITSALIATSGDGGLITADNNDAQMQELQHIMDLAHDRAPQEEHHDSEPATNSNEQGAAHTGAEGAMGRPDTAQRNHRYTIARHNDEQPHMAQTHARDTVSHLGIFAALGAPGGMEAGGQGPTSPFGGMTEAGLDAQSFQGNMTGDLPGDSFGYGGLGRVGTGFGGGGQFEGTIGTGRFGTIGRSDGNDSIGGSQGHHLAAREPGGPTIRPGHMDSVGTMSPEAIRRVVLRNLGQVQFCHQQGLQQNPQLAGRVAIRFVIGGDGNVLGAAVSDSNLAVPSVGTCIANAVRRWTFSTPEGGGNVIVTYPFNLQPAQ